MLPVPEISDEEAIFGTTTFLPAWEDLPEDFRRGWGGKEPHCRAAEVLFFSGGTLADLGFHPREGVDKEKAIKAIAAHLRSWTPQHEHKMAGVGYLISQWFEKAGELPA